MSDIKKNNKKKIKAQDTVESSAQAQKEETPSKISDGAEGENKDSPASLDVAAVAVDRAENDPSRRRLWFVRMPKPPEAPMVKALEQEVETYQAQVRLLTESLNVHKVDRDAIRENVRTARDALKRCRDAFDAKNAEVKPLRDALQSGGQASRKLREEFADLEARSESELDTKLEALKNRIEHESIPLNEEKKIIASIKKLEAQRPRVKEFEATVGVVAEVRADVDKLRAELHEHDAELSVLRKEKDTQQAILTSFREQEAEADAKVEAAMAERRRIKDLQDTAYTRMNEVRKSQRTKNDAHFTNRRLSRAVREAIAAGKVEEARAMCAEQMEEMHAKLASDDDFRAQYYAQWEEIRTLRAEAEGEEHGIVGAAADGDGDKKSGASKGKSAATASLPKEPVVEPAVKAQAVIAAALEAAATEAAAAGVVPEAVPAVASAHHSKNVSMEDVSLAAATGTTAAGAGFKAKKPKQQPKYVAEPVVVPEDNFTLPEAFLKKEQDPGATAASKAAERERNRQLQAEAEAKKQKREAEKAKRKAKAEELEKEALVKAKAAAAAALRGTPTGKDAASKAAAELAEASAAAAATAAKQKAAAKDSEEESDDEDEEEGEYTNPIMTGPRKSMQILKAGAARPTAKRPARNWRRGIFHQLQDLLEDLSDKENAIWIFAICLLLVLLINTLMQD